ncbi:MAG: MBL fold metallo-hydrolase [Corynebacterium sp.]|uniref:MBL fold metallo-hydrolase n=1 Tax=Corynebacterium sp. TaxID=1720 RepID=UPI0026DB3C7B|nr:MBL fold metallo-hydrolase [Corynebacterium sp.]MDO5029146.1 MBL fold metallo-hydrolase [Corynebacterium sp.]
MEIFGFAAGPFQTNCYVATGAPKMDELATPCVIIDPGMGAFDVVRAEVEKRNWKPEAILLTHGHIDHIRDVAQAAAHWDIPVLIHPEDNFMLANPKIGASQFAQLFDVDNMQAYSEAETYVDGDEVKWGGLNFEVIHAPGHSPGCVMLRASDGSDELVFSGDVLFQGSVGRTDLPGSNPEQMQQSLKNKVLPLPDELMILPGHGPASSIGDERATNPFLQELT